MHEYNMLTSHKQGKGITNRAQLSELRSENMYQRRLKRVWKIVCFSPNWNQDLYSRAARPHQKFQGAPLAAVP